nr:MAG TPA: hypothetical protein [Caudoviricetes sp.]
MIHSLSSLTPIQQKRTTGDFGAEHRLNDVNHKYI